jgi:predicted transcriptional regulator
MEGRLMANQSPIKVSEQTKERIRYLAALTDVTQADIVDRAVEEYAARHADAIAEGIERARLVLAGGDVAIASHLLDVPAEDIQRIAGLSDGTPASEGPS